MLLSVIIPVYNERRTLGVILMMVARALPNVSKEIIVVDDCSKDGTREWLKANFPEGQRSGSTINLDGSGNITFAREPGTSTITIRPIYHERNRGKGGGLQTGFRGSERGRIGNPGRGSRIRPERLGADVRSHRSAQGGGRGLWFPLLRAAAPLALFPPLSGQQAHLCSYSIWSSIKPLPTSKPATR